MKSILRGTLKNALSLYFVTLILPGVKVEGGLETYIVAGLIFIFLYKFLKPLLNIISLPLNIVTLGFFSFLINVLLFYIVTAIIPGISVSPFRLNGISFAGFVIPTLEFNSFLAYAAAAFAHSVLASFITWLRK